MRLREERGIFRLTGVAADLTAWLRGRCYLDVGAGESEFACLQLYLPRAAERCSQTEPADGYISIRRSLRVVVSGSQAEECRHDLRALVEMGEVHTTSAHLGDVRGFGQRPTRRSRFRR